MTETKDRKLCFIDVETTGTNPYKCSITQVAAVIDINGTVEDELNLLIQPFKDSLIEPGALQVTGLTRDDLFDSKRMFPVEAMKFICEFASLFIDKYNKLDKLWFVGYNCKFDWDFMQQFWKRCGDNYFGSWFCFPPIDVAQLAALMLIDTRMSMPDFKLKTVAEHLKVGQQSDVHNALADVKLTRDLYYATTRDRR